MSRKSKLFMNYAQEKVDTYSSRIISYKVPKLWSVSYQMEEKYSSPYKNDQKLWPWNAYMTQHIHLTNTRFLFFFYFGIYFI